MQPVHAEVVRLFIAILVPEEVKAEIKATQSAMREVARHASIRWTSREQFHLTLKFLGDVQRDIVPALTVALQSACAAYRRLELSATGVGFFPDANRPRVLWIGVTDSSNQLTELQRAVESTTSKFVAEQQRQEHFHGHITLARIKEARRGFTQALAKLAAEHSATVFGTWQVAQVILFRSELSPEGAKHTVLANFALNAGA
jgi:RNA 2',3'-cyclic 3'-phosphodiesterase